MWTRLALVMVVVVATGAGLPLWLAVALVLGVLALPPARGERWPRWKLPVRRAKATPVQGTIEPPSERHAYKPPTTVAALVEALSRAPGITVRPAADGAELQFPEDGEWARFTAALPDRVTQHTLALEGSSVRALGLLCDRLAPELGPMRLRVGAVELVIDGTRPRGLLERDLSSAVEAAALRERNAPRRPPPSPPRLLN
ncbi:MAG: hypothetical protein ACOZQL_15640 [Myxococcota bacterium]